MNPMSFRYSLLKSLMVSIDIYVNNINLTNFQCENPCISNIERNERRKDKERNQARQYQENTRPYLALGGHSRCSTVGGAGKSPLPLPWEIVTDNVSLGGNLGLLGCGRVGG